MYSENAPVALPLNLGENEEIEEIEETPYQKPLSKTPSKNPYQKPPTGCGCLNTPFSIDISPLRGGERLEIF